MTDIDPEILSKLEAVLIIADHPIATGTLAMACSCDIETAQAHLEALREEYSGKGGQRMRGWELRMAGGGWRLYANPAFLDAIEAYSSVPRMAKLSQAALETLAIIAYRQPIARSAISAIRGVNVDGVVRSLQTKNLIELVSTDETTGAAYYGTTQSFLEYMDINSLDELPPLAPLLPDESELEALDDDAAQRARHATSKRSQANSKNQQNPQQEAIAFPAGEDTPDRRDNG